MRLIDADALKNNGQIYIRTADGKDYYEIDDAPAVDAVEVVHGEWEFHKDGSGTCSKCHFTQKNVWDYDNWQNYCGHCGAKMDGERKVSE